MKSTSKHFTSLTYVKLFAVVVIIFAAISITSKSVQLLNASVLNTTAYSILILDRKAHVVSIDKSTGRLTAVMFDKVPRKLYESKDRTQHTLASSIALGIPIDGVVQSRVPQDYPSSLDFLSLTNVVKTFLQPDSYIYSSMNKMDVLKMYFAIRGIENDQVKNIPSASSENIAGISSEDLKDSTVAADYISIEVVNASGVNGLAARVGDMLQQSGFNVVAVSSKSNLAKSQIIERVEDSDTTKRLHRIFGFDSVHQNEDSIAQVTIVLGEDIEDLVY